MRQEADADQSYEQSYNKESLAKSNVLIKENISFPEKAGSTNLLHDLLKIVDKDERPMIEFESSSKYIPHWLNYEVIIVKGCKYPTTENGSIC